MPKTFPVIPVTKVIRAVPAVPPTRIVPGDVQQYPAISIEKRGSGSCVPPAQQERIVHRHVIGQSLRKISREEHRDFRTVAKVLRNNPAKLKEHLEAGRAQFYALTTQALETIRRAMEKGDAHLAYKLLVDAGVVPQQAMAGMATAPEQLTQDELTKKELGKVIQMAMERARDYDLPSDSIQMRPPKNAGPTESSP